MHPTGKDEPISLAELLSHDFIRSYLVPATRSFLEARRSCVVVAQSHARLAELDYLLEGGDAPTVYIARALRLAGSNRQILDLAQLVALQMGDVDLLSECWRKALTLDEPNWEQIADLAREFLRPEQILDRIVPSGKYALLFGSYLYSRNEDKELRERFLREALRRLPRDTGLSRAERLHFEAQAWSQLDDRDRAGNCIQEALGLEPRRADWRREYVDWLIAWGEPREAHEQALLGLAYAPGHRDTDAALERAAEAMSGGEREASDAILQ
jgi:hypothetical protein